MSSLKPFLWSNSTHIAYGIGAASSLQRYVARGQRILCLYDGDHIVATGAKADVEKNLEACGATFRWRKGIQKNPEYKTCLEIIQECRKMPVDMIIPVGGGSVMDASKFIASCINLPANIDPWTTLRNRKLIKDPLPLVSVVTLAGTGSEWNEHFVISRRETNEKLQASNKALLFRLSILDPRYTLTVPKKETANGLFDSFSHVCEQYVTSQLAPIQDRLSEALLSSIVDLAPKLMNDLQNVNHRGTAMLSSSLALNGMISLGTSSCWGSHTLAHSLTARYGIDHAQTLALIMPWYWRRFFDMKKHKLAQMAKRVWGYESGASIDDLARYSISKTEEFAKNLGYSLKLSDIVKEPPSTASLELTEMTLAATNGAPIGEAGSAKPEDIKAIFEAVF